MVILRKRSANSRALLWTIKKLWKMALFNPGIPFKLTHQYARYVVGACFSQSLVVKKDLIFSEA